MDNELIVERSNREVIKKLEVNGLVVHDPPKSLTNCFSPIALGIKSPIIPTIGALKDCWDSEEKAYCSGIIPQ